MDLFSLKLFLDTAQEKSFVKAARLNFRSQAAVSFHIQKLESELNVRLFERKPHKVLLTPEGEILLHYAEEIWQSCERAKTHLGRYQQMPQDHVKIGAIYSVGMYELAPVLKHFIRHYPKIDVELQYLPSEKIYAMVNARSIDLGIVAYPRQEARMDVIPFGMDTMVLIMPMHHRLAKKTSIDWQEIEGENFIAFKDGIPTGDVLKRVIKDSKINLKIHMTYDNVDTLKRAVEVGSGISIVPKKTVLEELKKKTLKACKIRGTCLLRPLGILVHKHALLCEGAQVFLKILASFSEKSYPRLPAAGIEPNSSP